MSHLRMNMLNILIVTASPFKFQIIFLLKFSAVFMYFRLSIMSQKKKDHSVPLFQEDWLTKEKFKFWLRKVEKKATESILCYLQLNNRHCKWRIMGSAVTSERKTHSELVMKRNENRVSNLFKKKSVNSTATTANLSGKDLCKTSFCCIRCGDDLVSTFSALTSILPVMQSSSHGFPEDVQDLFSSAAILYEER